MRYRGFEIDCNASSDKEMIYSMSVYDGADDLRKHCLYELYDIDTDGDINEKVMSIVDDNYDEITLNQNYYRSERNRELLGRLATCLRESLDNAALYQTLNELVGMETATHEYSDPRQDELNRCWESLDPERQDRILADAHDMEAAKSLRNSSVPSSENAG